MRDFLYKERNRLSENLSLEELFALEREALIEPRNPTKSSLDISIDNSSGEKKLAIRLDEKYFEVLTEEERGKRLPEYLKYLNQPENIKAIVKFLFANGFKVDDEGALKTFPIAIFSNGEEVDLIFNFTPDVLENLGAEEIKKEIEQEKKNADTNDSQPKDDNRIIWEKSDDNKHLYNNTGYIFRRANGEPITDASEVRKFIKAQKNSEDPEIRKQFREDFPVAQKGTTAGYNAPTLEIEGYKHKYYSMLGNPKWGMEDEEPIKEEPTKDTDYIGSYVNNKPAKVNVPDGIILHATPDIDDPLYHQIKRSDFKDDFLLNKGSKLEIIAKSNNDNPGWVMVRDENNRVGWIEERYLKETEPTDVLAQYTGSWYQVKKGEGVAEILINEISAKDQAGADMRNFALAFKILNANNPGIYSADHSWYWTSYRTLIDPSIEEAIDNYKNIEVQEGIWVRIPTRAFLEKAKADGLIKTASPEAQMFIDFGRYGSTFLEGIYDGLVTSAQDFAEGIWEIIEGIFTGDILDQFKEMWEAVKQLISNPSQLIEAFSGLIDDFESKWNIPDQMEAWHFRGEVLGQILFEIVMALIGIGAASLLNKLKKIGKLGKMITSMESKIGKVKNKVTPKLPTKRPPTNKKGDLTYSPIKDETLKEAFDKKKKDFETQFDKDLHNPASDLIKDRAAAYIKYKAKGGKMSQSKWELKYNTLYKNRKIGKIGEDTFKDFMDGYKPDFGIDAKSGTRYIDNVKPGTKTAREIKTGKVGKTSSIQKQIKKDLEILSDPDIEIIKKIEWHFLDGLSPDLESELLKIQKALGKDKFDFVDYTK